MRNRLKISFLDSDMLKIIAVLTMLIDHLGASLLIEALRFMSAEAYDNWLPIYHVLRNVGRMSFPIFVFLLVEGFFYTRSRKKYLERLLLFSLLSEIPFDLAFYGSPFYEASQNVFWTFAIGLLVMWGMEKMREVRIKKAGIDPRAGRYFVPFEAACDVLLLPTGCLAANVLCTDYGTYGMGILLIMLFYFGKRFNVPRIFTCVAGYLLFLWEPWCVVGFALLLFYNGTRKKRGRGFQYFFYLFYPVHLVILGLIRVVFFTK